MYDDDSDKYPVTMEIYVGNLVKYSYFILKTYDLPYFSKMTPQNVARFFFYCFCL
jgi:hypothetical protein